MSAKYSLMNNTPQGGDTLLYRLEILISEKALKENKRPSDIKREVSDLLGISTKHFSKIRRATSDSSGYLKSRDLLTISKYFQVEVSEIFNTKLHTPVTSPEA